MQNKIREISKYWLSFIFWSGVFFLLLGAMLFSCGMAISCQGKSLAILLLVGIAFGFLLGGILIWARCNLFEKVEGRIGIIGDEIQHLDGIFRTKDLKGVIMFNPFDIPGEIVMKFNYLEGGVFKKLKYVIKYEVLPGDDALRLFINKFRDEIVKDRLWFNSEVLAFTHSLLYEFQEAKSQNLIAGKFYNPQSFCQQSEFVKLVHADLNSKLQEAGLRLTEVRFFF